MDELEAKIAFMVSVLPFAKLIEQTTGLTARFPMAQVALETGWGQRILKDTNNLFNIKATEGWQGRRLVFYVPEYKDGKRVYSYEPFRAYPTVAESFDDWLELMQTSRYNAIFAPEVRGDVRRIAELVAKAGYAPDPRYADLLAGVATGPTMEKVFARNDALEEEARKIDHRAMALI